MSNAKVASIRPFYICNFDPVNIIPSWWKFYQFFYRLVVVLSQNFIRIEGKMNELHMIIFTWVNFKCAPFCRVLKQPFWSRNGCSETVFATIGFKVIFYTSLALIDHQDFKFCEYLYQGRFYISFCYCGWFLKFLIFDNCAFLYIGIRRK